MRKGVKPKNFLRFDLSLLLKVILERTSYNTTFPKYAAEGGILLKRCPSKRLQNYLNRLFKDLSQKIMIIKITSNKHRINITTKIPEPNQITFLNKQQ